MMQFNQTNNNQGGVFNAISGAGSVSQVMAGKPKVIFEPAVYLIGQPCVNGSALQAFLEDNDMADWHRDIDADQSETLCEIAGRNCYQSFKNPRPGGNKAYLEHIIESSHGSVLEHAVWNFIFTGISRSLTHELVRHRAGWAYSMLSQRYVDEKDCAFVVPYDLADEIREALAEDAFAAPTDGSRVGHTWLEAVAKAQHNYGLLVDHLDLRFKGRATNWNPDAKLTQEQRTASRKEARQAARSVLPNCTETKIFATANARALRHFIEMRASRYADVEIRRLAGKVHEILVQEAPALFGDYRRVKLPDGTYELTTDYRKV